MCDVEEKGQTQLLMQNFLDIFKVNKKRVIFLIKSQTFHTLQRFISIKIGQNVTSIKLIPKG